MERSTSDYACHGVYSPQQYVLEQLCFAVLPRLLAGLLLMLGVSALVGAEEAPGAGHLALHAAGGHQSSAILQSSEVHMDISGMTAVVSLQQTFSNSNSDWVEGVYAFPLPSTAAVRHMEIEVGDRRIVGEIRERAEAKAVYEAARRAGRRPAWWSSSGQTCSPIGWPILALVNKSSSGWSTCRKWRTPWASLNCAFR